jgi:hypothetical protein
MDRPGVARYAGAAVLGSAATLGLLAATQELAYRWVRHRMKQAGKIF